MIDTEIWAAALCHSTTSDSEVRLYFAIADLPRGGLAEAFGPGQPIPGDFALSETDRHDALTCRSAFRIVVRAEGLPRVLVWAIVRHELQHCVQQRTLGFPISRVGYALDASLLKAFGHRAGVHALYHEIPTEADANAAATDFTSAILRAERDAVGPEWDAILRARPADPIETLNVRQACFAAAIGGAYADVSTAQLDRPLMDVYSLLPGGRQQWERIVSDPELRRLTSAVISSQPSEQAIADAPRPALAWTETRARLLVAATRAQTLVPSADES